MLRQIERHSGTPQLPEKYRKSTQSAFRGGLFPTGHSMTFRISHSLVRQIQGTSSLSGLLSLEESELFKIKTMYVLSKEDTFVWRHSKMVKTLLSYQGFMSSLLAVSFCAHHFSKDREPANWQVANYVEIMRNTLFNIYVDHRFISCNNDFTDWLFHSKVHQKHFAIWGNLTFCWFQCSGSAACSFDEWRDSSN